MSYFLYSKQFIHKGIHRDLNYSVSSACDFWSNCLYYIQYPIFFLLSVLFRIPILDQFFEFMITNWSRSVMGFALRGIYWKTKLGKMGQDVFIDRGVTFFPTTKTIEIGNTCHLDVFVTISSSGGHLKIGDRVCIGSNTFINCSPFLEIGNDVAIGNNCTILAGATKMMSNNIVIPSCSLSNGHQDALRGVIIDDFASVAINCTIVPTAHLAHPPFTIIDGPLVIGFLSVLGSHSFLIDSMDPLVVWAGVPAKKISDFKDFIFDMYAYDSTCMENIGGRGGMIFRDMVKERNEKK